MAKNNSSLKSTAVVFGALGFAWLAIELALKPWLDKARANLDKADPTRDPDDADEADQISQADKPQVDVNPPEKNLTI